MDILISCRVREGIRKNRCVVRYSEITSYILCRSTLLYKLESHDDCLRHFSIQLANQGDMAEYAINVVLLSKEQIYLKGGNDSTSERTTTICTRSFKPFL